MVFEFIISYAIIFITSLIGSASLFFPLPSFILIPITSVFLNPFLVAIVASIGAAIGELTGYAIGYSGKKIFLKHRKFYDKILQNKGMFFVIIIFAATPLPFDIIGLIAGITQYDIKKFMLATFIGKLIMSLILSFIGISLYEIISNLIWT